MVLEGVSNIDVVQVRRAFRNDRPNFLRQIVVLFAKANITILDVSINRKVRVVYLEAIVPIRLHVFRPRIVFFFVSMAFIIVAGIGDILFHDILLRRIVDAVYVSIVLLRGPRLRRHVSAENLQGP